MSSRSVIPLESNPEIFNALAEKLGLSPILGFHDVYSISDPDLMAFLSQPVYGVIMLFPITEGYENHRKETDRLSNPYDSSKLNDVKWFKQTIGNGCGLYALLHMLLNLPDDFILENLVLKRFILSKLNPSISIEETSSLVEALEQSIQLDENYGSKGQTEAPDAAVQITLHFITFIKGKDNHLYELDGRRSGPVDLGESVDDDHILRDSKLIEKIKFYMDTTDEENRNNFALMSIAPSIE